MRRWLRSLFRVTRDEMGLGARGLFFLGTGFSLLALGVGVTTAISPTATTTTTTTVPGGGGTGGTFFGARVLAGWPEPSTSGTHATYDLAHSLFPDGCENGATGTATNQCVFSATSNTLRQLGVDWPVNSFAGMTVKIVRGTDLNDVRTIASNTADTITLTASWSAIPDATSGFRIYPVGSAGTSCTTGLNTACPTGIGWTTFRGMVATRCLTISGYRMGGLDVQAHNSAQLGDFTTPCVTASNMLFTGGVTVSSAVNLAPCTFDAGGASVSRGTCGPLIVTDSSIIVPNSAEASNSVFFGDTNWQCLRCLMLYGRTDFNCQGWCDLEDSFAVSGFIANGGHAGTVSDVNTTSSDTSTFAPFFTAIHNTIHCRMTNGDVGQPDGTAGAGCTGDLNYVVHGCAGGNFNENPTPMVINFDANLLVVGGNDGNALMTLGDNCLVFPNARVTNNVFETLRVSPAQANTNAGTQLLDNGTNKWCNNRTETGTLVGSPATGGDFNCP